MARKIRQPFTPGGKFVASRDFKFHGHKFTTGDDFPWRTLSCSVRKLRQLYEGRYLNNEYIEESKLYEDEAENAPEPETQESPDGTAAEETESDDESEEDESDDEEDGLFYDPDRHEIVNPGRGEWYMDEDGEHVIQLTAKEAKRLRKKLDITDINPDCVIED